MNYLSENKTILKPVDFEFYIEVELIDCDNIYEPLSKWGSDPVYLFTARPLESYSYGMLDRLVEEAEGRIMRDSGPYADKEPRSAVYGKHQELVFSQLFDPRVEGEDKQVHELFQRKARIKANLRDDPTGLIFLNASYVDLHAKPEEEFVCSASKYADLDDF